EDEQGREIYRASARIYDLQPEPDDNAVVMAQLAAATLSAVTREVVSSLSDWPDQRMNYESRRRRIPPSRMTEFNERLNELLAEFWGDPEAPVDDESDDPGMAFSSIWYRYPDPKGGGATRWSGQLRREGARCRGPPSARRRRSRPPQHAGRRRRGCARSGTARQGRPSAGLLPRPAGCCSGSCT